MSIVRKVCGSGLAVAMMAIAAAVGVAPASAQTTGWERCPSNRFCIFEHADGRGKYAYFSQGWQDLAKPIGGFVFDNKTSSVWNRMGGMDACFYENRDYGGGAYFLPEDSARINLSAYWNDRISSLRQVYNQC
jgi:hypothetical protein